MDEVYALARENCKTFFAGTPSGEVDFGSQQFLDLLLEPQTLYHVEQQLAARFALCSRGSNGRLVQELFDVSRLDWAMSQVQKMKVRDQTDFWISQATLHPGARNRRISSIIGLNAVWCDIDLLHPPKSFKDQLPLGDLSNPVVIQRLAALLAMQLNDNGLPPPTYIVATGGGLCPKWVFERSLPSTARARWQSLQNKVVSKISEIKGELGGVKWAWPVDTAASDAARVLRLVGSVNPRWDAPCRVVWESGKQFDFDYLADEILDYTREEVEAYRKKSRAGKEAGEEWDANRVAALAAGIRPRRERESAKKDPISDEAGRELWTQRYEFGRQVIESRGGAQEGSRNNHFWPLANALAHSCSTVDQLVHELAALHQSLFHHKAWTRSEAMKSAGSVITRMKSGELYKMKNQTFFILLGVTPAEKKAFGGMLQSGAGHNLKRASWSEGVMGFERISGLSSEAYITETRRRQALAGARSAATRKTNYGEEVRAKAREMREAGASVRKIAAALGISTYSASTWSN